jgi:hypothetical protein
MTFTFFKNWLLFFMGLIVLDLFVEAFVFEWLEWNGTTKNDWFFILWWLIVLMWFIYGANKLFKTIK